LAHFVPKDLLGKIPAFTPGEKVATRNAGGVILQPVAEQMPLFDHRQRRPLRLDQELPEGEQGFWPGARGECNIWFGIREHGMGAILNGIAYDGIFRPSGATFAVFADYLLASIRLAALAKLPVLYIFTHDSVGVGEDGPTHQPVETWRWSPGDPGARCDAAGRWRRNSGRICRRFAADGRTRPCCC